MGDSLTKGYREDGQYCFMKAFDHCSKDDCSCENYKHSEGSNRWANVATLMMMAHEEIFEDKGGI